MISFKDYFLLEMNLVNKQDMVKDIDRAYGQQFYDVPLIRKWFNTNAVNYFQKLPPDDGMTMNQFEPYTPTEEDPSWMHKPGVMRWNGISPVSRIILDHIADYFKHLLNLIENGDENQQIEAQRFINKLPQTAFTVVLVSANEWVKKMNQNVDIAVFRGDEKIVYEFRDGYTIRELLTKQSRKREGKLMGHCVASDSYGKPGIRIYSLRDPKNMPHATIELDGGDYDPPSIVQIKGKENIAPIKKYWPYLEEWIKTENFNIADDGENIGMKKWDDVYYFDDQWEEIYQEKIIPVQKMNIKQIVETAEKNNGVYNGSIRLGSYYFREMPDLSNIKVNGFFSCKGLGFKSLKGSPKEVRGMFVASYNNFETLEGAPRRVGGKFFCNYNKNLKSLKGGPKQVSLEYYCNDTSITSLEGAPKKCKQLVVYNTPFSENPPARGDLDMNYYIRFKE